MFEFNSVFINPYEVVSARIDSQLGRIFLVLSLSNGEVLTEYYNTREEALSIINELSTIIDPFSFDDDEDEDWM